MVEVGATLLQSPNIGRVAIYEKYFRREKTSA